MADLSNLEARLAALEARVEVVAADAAAAGHLTAARDRDLADVGMKVDANRSVINALGEQTAARFTRLEQQLEEQIGSVRTEMRSGFGEMRGRLDQAAAGQQQIGELLTTLIEREDGQ